MFAIYSLRYADILIAGAEASWAPRRENGDRLVINAFALYAGYQGSFPPPDGRLPQRVTTGLALSRESHKTVTITACRVAPELR